ncbi:MAG: transcriptional regulator [Candidatus Doudnabacteria bacterium]|nr:transcriptional regulator [Candidatus Doudnabacteria bacterium]
MKKTININIGGTIFNIEEDAYAKLEQYLESIKKHFSSYPDHEEIIKDMESRIAEHFSDDSKSKIISENDVENLIASMGTTADFQEGADSSTDHTTKQTRFGGRRVMRDADNKIVAGVASGLAAYAGIDPLIVRLVFIVIVLFGGSGILLYLILWLVLPEAKTPTEKMEMRGEAINLSNLDNQIKSVKTQANEFKERVKTHGGSGLEKLVAAIGVLFKVALKIASKLIGLFIGLGAMGMLAAITFAAINLLFNAHSPYVQFPLAQISGGPDYYFSVFVIYLIALIPVIFVLLLAVTLLFRKNALNYKSGFSLLGLWFIGLMAAGFMWVRFGPTYIDKIQSRPEYQQQTKTIDLKGFTKLDLHGVDHVHLVQSDKFNISETGRQIDLDRVTFEVKNNALVFVQKSDHRFCFFCGGRNTINVEIAMPKIDEIDVNGWTKFNAENLKTDKLILNVGTVASANLGVTTKEADISVKDSGDVIINGSADSLALSAADSSNFDGQNFIAKDAVVSGKDLASLRINALNTMKITLNDFSNAVYFGKAKISQVLNDQTTLEPGE